MRVTVLVAEDDDDDYFFTARVLTRTRQAEVVRVESGRAVVDYLLGAGPYEDRGKFPWPDLVLLDLKMGEMDGHGVLAWVAKNAWSQPPRIFVLTGSGESRDRERVQATGMAEGYLVKPLTPDNLAEILKLPV
ncbi:response regulator [Horticoccus luteus]|uniref:Response regulator n=1 Tax=Horticoccus luteus TaxID=2862869 RepID=A0A8F9TWX2_9BACT|nr:response regulator [Horticoccus luteus]QYM79542.1 response regulator [Horticoccus luteus]